MRGRAGLYTGSVGVRFLQAPGEEGLLPSGLTFPVGRSAEKNSARCQTWLQQVKLLKLMLFRLVAVR
jgi:hypothetical protein